MLHIYIGIRLTRLWESGGDSNLQPDAREPDIVTTRPQWIPFFIKANLLLNSFQIDGHIILANLLLNPYKITGYLTMANQLFNPFENVDFHNVGQCGILNIFQEYETLD